MLRQSEPFSPGPGGLFESLRALLATLVAMAQARAELCGVELEEEARRLVELLVGAMIVLLLAGLALLFGALVIVAALWDTHRVAAVVTVAASFAALASIAWQVARVRTRRHSRLLSATVGELAKDQRWLRRPAP